MYSWGRNEQGFLGRESKTDLRNMLFSNDNTNAQKKLGFSNFYPEPLHRLAKFKVKRIAIKEGKFMAFLVNHPYLSARLDDDEESHLSDHDEAPAASVIDDHTTTQQTESLSQTIKEQSSEFDSEEEKDVVIGVLHSSLNKNVRKTGQTSSSSQSSRHSSDSF